MGARSLIQTPKAEKTTESGLILSEKENEAAPVVGTVVRKGSESKYEVGQTVLFRRYSIDELKLQSASGDTIVHLIEDEEVVATIEQ